jgi:hypothetical protein
MVVADIAYRKLSDHAKSEVDRLLAIDALPESRTFATASVWADDLKGFGVHAFDAWHYVDLPFSPDNTPLVQPEKRDNVEWAIGQCLSTLRSAKAPDVEKSRALKFLIHFVGDAHMPLHCTGRFTAANPDGDAGGNKFRLTGKYRNLHAYWDSGAGMFEDIPRPLTSDGEKALHKMSDDFTAAYPLDKLTEAEDLKVSDWIKEGFETAKASCYSTPEGAAPNDEYRDKAQAICKQKVALGGYRLAGLLNDIFK